MPKTKQQQGKYPARYLLLMSMLTAAKTANDKDHKDLPRIIGRGTATMTRRLEDPGSLTLDELTALGRGLHLPIEDLRAAIRY